MGLENGNQLPTPQPRRQSFGEWLRHDWLPSLTIPVLVQSSGFFLASIAGIGFVIVVVKLAIGGRNPPTVDDLFWLTLISNNSDVISIFIVSILCSLFALRLFSKAGALTSPVIRDSDREFLVPLIESGNKHAIGEYIRLASLSGFSGTFQYLGFTGLPLATVILTLILLGTALIVKDTGLGNGVFDMAKLTLGAFLGSFVQRNLEQEKLIRGESQSGTRPERHSERS